MLYSHIVDHRGVQRTVGSAGSWIPTSPTSIRKGVPRIFGLTGAKDCRTTSSSATQSLMRVRCFFGGKCMNKWAAQTRAWSFAAIGNYGQRWLLREELHT